MNNTRIGAMTGTSSPSKLAPETIKIRNALIEKYADQPIEELNEFLQRTLEVEKDELKRLGLLAARVYILRQKVLSLKTFIRDERLESLPTPNLALTEQILLDETANSDIDVTGVDIPTGEWHSLQMIEPGEVNGVRFFEGTVINAKSEDAEKLIASGKAIFIDEEGNAIENNAAYDDDSLDNIDTPETKGDATHSGVSDNEDADHSNSLAAEDSDDSTNNIDTLEPKADAVDEAAAIDATDNSVVADDEKTNDSKSEDVEDSDDSMSNANKLEPKTDTIDEVAAVESTDNSSVADEQNVNASESEDAKEETDRESAENKDAKDSENKKV